MCTRTHEHISQAHVISFPRGFCVGIYATNSAEACQYVITRAKVNILLVENDLQLQKILSVKTGPPGGPQGSAQVSFCSQVDANDGRGASRRHRRRRGFSKDLV